MIVSIEHSLGMHACMYACMLQLSPHVQFSFLQAFFSMYVSGISMRKNVV